MDNAGVNYIRDPDCQVEQMLLEASGDYGSDWDLVVSVPPETRQLDLAWELLRALGKSSRFMPGPDRPWLSLEFWLAASSVRRIFFNYSARIDQKVLSEIHRRVGRPYEDFKHHSEFPEFWFVDTSRKGAMPSSLLVHRTWNVEEFAHRQAEISERRLSLADRTKPSDPFDELLHLRHKTLQDLPDRLRNASPIGFVEVAKQELPKMEYRESTLAFSRAVRTLQSSKPAHAGVPGFATHRYARPDELTLLQRLRLAMNSSPNEVVAMIRLKAAQLVAFKRGYFLDHPPLPELMEASTIGLDELETIETFANPADARIALIAVASGLDLLDLSYVLRSDTRRDFIDFSVTAQGKAETILRLPPGVELSRTLSSIGHTCDPQEVLKSLTRIQAGSKIRLLTPEWPRTAGLSLKELGRVNGAFAAIAA